MQNRLSALPQPGRAPVPQPLPERANARVRTRRCCSGSLLRGSAAYGHADGGPALSAPPLHANSALTHYSPSRLTTLLCRSFPSTTCCSPVARSSFANSRWDEPHTYMDVRAVDRAAPPRATRAAAAVAHGNDRKPLRQTEAKTLRQACLSF